MTAQFDPARVKAIERAQKAWTSQLVDLGGRNTLLYYRDLKVGTLDLGPRSGANQAAVQQLLNAKAIPLTRLFPGDACVDATKRARSIRAKAQENFEERGLRTLFLGWGIATWTSTRSTSDPAAPVLLRPATLTPRGRAEETFELSLVDDWDINSTLRYCLEEDFDISFDARPLLELLEATNDFAPDATVLFEQLTKIASSVPGFSIAPRVVLGNFSYAKWEMVQDLQTGTDALLASDLLCAIAGYEPAANALRQRVIAVDEAEPDRTPPEDEFLILDADASQSYVINAAVRGSNLVVEGPPGTGKSQTISNLIATLVARGKTVLFVAEKRAAIDAVIHRLSAKGLAGVVLDVHGGVTSKRELAKDLARARNDAFAIPVPDVAEVRKTLVRSREDRIRHVRSLHEKRDPWQLSVYDVLVRLSGHDDVSHSRLRLRGSDLVALDAEAYDRARGLLRDYADLGGLRLSLTTSPWADAFAAGTVPTVADAQAAGTAVSALECTWAEASRRLADFLSDFHLRAPRTIAAWADVLEFFEELAATHSIFEPVIFTLPLAELASAMAPGAKAPARAFAALFDSGYRDAKKQLRAILKPGVKLSGARLRKAVLAALEQTKRWAAICSDGGTPRVPPDLAGLRATYDELLAKLHALRPYLGELDLEQLSADELTERLTALAHDTETLAKLPELTKLKSNLSKLGLGQLVVELSVRQLDVDAALAELDFVWAASIFDYLVLEDPVIRAFDGETATRRVKEFVDADRAHIASGPHRVRRAVAERIVAACDQFPQQEQLVVKQERLSRGLLPLRELYQRAPDLLRAIKPCWAMSPLVVSQILPMARCFDVAIFDEASQVRPEDAAGVIARATQVIVAGDSKQLPPTSFFSTSGEDLSDDDLDGEGGEASLDQSLLRDLESVLDQMGTLLPPPVGTRTLRWHYRSRDERLIAFSNAQASLYNHGLITFPGITIDGALRHVHVPWKPGRIAESDSSSEEVAAVIDLISEHARTRPEESLGVIAMGIKHANRIEEALRRARENDDVLDDFIARQSSSVAGAEPFFVKNLERVQGDERDAIILTVGYTKTSDGRMLYRFGPLNNAGGERRLNVAITRARSHMTVVSSFTSADLDPDRLKAEGAKMLRRYLEYAESGGSKSGEYAKERPDLNPFERDVQRQLTRAGIPLIPQWGCSGYWIDFVAQHPRQPGRMVLAIECDGATYHSSPTARDRDRLRQEHLERLGWKFHRIWSIEWFRHRDREIQRALGAYHDAVAAADAGSPRSATVDERDRRELQREPVVAERGGPMPISPNLGSIRAYSHGELVELIRWINSDGLLRTREQLVTEALGLLGFKRRGKNIVDALQAAIDDARGTPGG